MYLFDGGWKRKREREVDVSSRMNNRRLVRAVVVCVVFLASLLRVSKPGKCKQERLPEQRRSGGCDAASSFSRLI